MGGHSTRQHRRFSPSQSERFLLCPGSVALLERVPAREESPYAIEGTKAHEVLDAALRNGVRRALQAHKEFVSEPLRSEKFENDFYYSVQIALNYIYAILDEHPDAVLYVEREVSVPVESAPGEADGYCDVGIYIPSILTLYVIDYKHGAGVAKAVEGNTQVLQYGLGFLYGEGAPVDPATVDCVVAVILQPRAFHEDGYIREYSLTPFQVYEYLDVLEEGIRACLAPNAPLIPGEEQCRFCDARTLCPAREAKAVAPLRAAGHAIANIMEVKQPQIPHPSSIDVDRLAYIMQAAPMLRKLLDDVEKHVFELSQQGVHVPGTKLVETQPRRKWYGDENEVAFKLQGLIGCDITDIIENKLITITQAERLVIEAFKARVGRGKKKQAAEDAKQSFAYLTSKEPTGNLTLVLDDDPRPAVNRATAAFAQIAEAVQPPQMAENED